MARLSTLAFLCLLVLATRATFGYAQEETSDEATENPDGKTEYSDGKQANKIAEDVFEEAEDEREPKEMKYFERSFVDVNFQAVRKETEEKLKEELGIAKNVDPYDDLPQTWAPGGTYETSPKRDIVRLTGDAETDRANDARIRGQNLFNEGVFLVNRHEDKKSIRRAYALFQEAWKWNHTEAGGIVAIAHLFGIHFKQNLEYAKEMLMNLSSVGEPRAQGGMGLLYSLGLVGFNRSLSKSLVYYTFGALGENPLSMMALAYKNWQGIGVPQSCEGALVWYRKVADRVAEDVSLGSPIVTRVRLQDQFENPNFFTSLFDQDLIQYFQFIADKGDTKAQIGLGQLHYQGGRGVNVDHTTAVAYFKHAAEKSNNANAQAYLGRMYMEDNSHSKKNYDLAYKYFKDAADQNNAMGQAGLGQLYLNGFGVKKNHQDAIKYFRLSADQGYVEGQLYLGLMHFRGLGIPRDTKKAIKYFNLASQNGHTLAFYYLAQMQESGLGMLRSCHMAVELYKNVAERGKWSEMFMIAHDAYMAGKKDEAFMVYVSLAEMGFEVAISNVAFMLEHQETSIISGAVRHRLALSYWEKAAAQGYTQARVKVGDYHYYGRGTDLNYEEAVTHYRQASDQFQNAQAMFNLAYMHELGLGMKQDIHLAKRYYDMAAETSNDAHIPVILALCKLAINYGLEPFYNENTKEHYQIYFTVDYWLGTNWDLYTITVLVLIFSTLAFFIFNRRR